MKRVDMDFERVVKGMRLSRDLAEHEVFMSFNDDSGAYAFQDWWSEEGEKQFAEWCLESDEYRDDVEKYGVES